MDELLNTENSIENSIENENIETQVVSEVEQATLDNEPNFEEPVAEIVTEVPQEIVPEQKPAVEAKPEIQEPEVTEADFAGLNKEEILEKIRYYIHDSEKEDCKKEIDILRKMYYDKQREDHEK